MNATYVSSTSFTVSGDQTSLFTVGRRVKCNCGTDGYKYGWVFSAVYSSPNTTIILTSISDALTSNLTTVDIGLISPGLTGSLPDLIIKIPWVDVRIYANFHAAIAAIAATPTVLLIPNAQTLTQSETIPATLTLKIIQGGSVVKASTYTLTINGSFEAGLYQVFSGFSTGDVTFGSGSVKEVYPEWWGITGTADDVCIQKAINSLPSSGGIIQLLGKTYNLNANLLVKSFTIIQGQGDATILKLANNKSTDLINSGNYPSSGNGDYTILRNFKIDGNKSNQSAAGSIVWYGTTRPIFENLHVVDMYGIGILLRQTTRGLIHKNHIDSPRLDGIGIYDGSSFCEIRDNVVENCGGSFGIQILGIEVAGQAETLSCIIANNISRYNNTGIGFISGSRRHICTGNQCLNNASYGIMTRGDLVTTEREVSDILIEGNICGFNVDGIRIDGISAYSDDIDVFANFCHDNTNGINITAQARTPSVYINRLRGNTNALMDNGSGSVIYHNPGYVN